MLMAIKNGKNLSLRTLRRPLRLVIWMAKVMLTFMIESKSIMERNKYTVLNLQKLTESIRLSN